MSTAPTHAPPAEEWPSEIDLFPPAVWRFPPPLNTDSIPTLPPPAEDP